MLKAADVIVASFHAQLRNSMYKPMWCITDSFYWVIRVLTQTDTLILCSSSPHRSVWQNTYVHTTQICARPLGGHTRLAKYFPSVRSELVFLLLFVPNQRKVRQTAVESENEKGFLCVEGWSGWVDVTGHVKQRAHRVAASVRIENAPFSLMATQAQTWNGV